MSPCIKCGLPAISGSNFCSSHEADLDGREILYAKGSGSIGPSDSGPYASYPAEDSPAADNPESDWPLSREQSHSSD